MESKICRCFFYLQELLKFIEDSEHGVIYISFGTILKPSSIKPEKLKSIIEALEELPQRVVWKWNKRTLPGNPKNIYLSKWLPQNDILGTFHHFIIYPLRSQYLRLTQKQWLQIKFFVHLQYRFTENTSYLSFT